MNARQAPFIKNLKKLEKLKNLEPIALRPVSKAFGFKFFNFFKFYNFLINKVSAEALGKI